MDELLILKTGQQFWITGEVADLIVKQAATIKELKEDAEFWYSRLSEKDFLLWPDHKNKHTDLIKKLEAPHD